MPADGIVATAKPVGEDPTVTRTPVDA
jgi:hypothetical protein